MKEYEIHVSASYKSQGGQKEWTYFKEYVMADTKAQAKAKMRAELKEQGYHNITLAAIEA